MLQLCRNQKWDQDYWQREEMTFAKLPFVREVCSLLFFT